MPSERIFRSVTHLKIAQGQVCLTSWLFRDRLPKKKLQLIGVYLLTLLSPWAGCHILTPLRDRRLYWSTTSYECPLLTTSVCLVPTAHPKCLRTNLPCARAPDPHMLVGSDTTL